MVKLLVTELEEGANTFPKAGGLFCEPPGDYVYPFMLLFCEFYESARRFSSLMPCGRAALIVHVN